MKYQEEYRDPAISRRILENIKKVSKRQVRLMEVCGTHTVSIFRSGIGTVLPDTISLLSGPGCPVCVTTQKEIDTFIEIAKRDGVIVVTFGDVMRVPGSSSSLQRERAEGRDIRIVYSTRDALKIAEKNPDKKVVFLGVGFETTAPSVAASILSASRTGLDNFLVFSAHKLVPPALVALMENHDVDINGFILPGHVSVIIGTRAYLPFFEQYQVPCVISGFETADLLQAIYTLVGQFEKGKPELKNAYRRAVTFKGNGKAQKIMGEVFERIDTAWRGLGTIKESGLGIKEKFGNHDAEKAFEIEVPESEAPKSCACGEILTGIKIPPECPLYKKACTPVEPVGPCMVSSEGTCAAYYRYYGD